MILNSMKKNSNLAQKKLSEAEQFDAWTSLVEFLNVSGPKYDIFTWMMVSSIQLAFSLSPMQVTVTSSSSYSIGINW